ncbi:MAG: universal stress protein [Kiloniellales bacterium]|nr:universal stress protein [Kiloniellales bacterium]
MFKDILFAVDLPNQESQDKALQVAIAEARASDATLHVMTVVPDFGLSIVGSYFPEGFEKKAIDEATQHLHDYVKTKVPAQVSVQHIVCHGSVYSEILRTAKEIGCDLIVMASHRPELQDYLLGPNAARVVRHALCSVLVVRDA